MKIESENLEDHQVKLTVQFEAETFEQAKRRAARKIAKRTKIPGFRPGKAPYGVIARHVGEGRILEDALDIILEEEYPGIIEGADIEPYGPGRLENVVSLDPPELEFLVPLQAEVTLGDYKAIEIPYETPEVTEDELEENLENLRKQHAELEPVERPAGNGDLVFAMVSGKRLDKEDEEEATLFESRFSSVEIDPEKAENKNEFPFPGFSTHIVDLSKDEEKTISYTYPDDYEDEDLQGVEAEFQVSVTNVQTRTLPDLDDEFAKKVSEHEDF